MLIYYKFHFTKFLVRDEIQETIEVNLFFFIISNFFKIIYYRNISFITSIVSVSMCMSVCVFVIKN